MKRKLVSLEEALKATPAQFLEWLRRNGKKTFPVCRAATATANPVYSKDVCPIVSYLKARTGITTLACSLSDVQHPDGYLSLPYWMQAFIRDHGGTHAFAGKTYAAVRERALADPSWKEAA